MAEQHQAARSGSVGPIPDPRFLQANERTLLSWVRTSFSFMAFGFLVARVALGLEEGPSDGVAARPIELWFGIGLMLLGVATALIGAGRHMRMHRALVRGLTPTYGVGLILVMVFTLTLFGALLAVYLFVRGLG